MEAAVISSLVDGRLKRDVPDGSVPAAACPVLDSWGQNELKCAKKNDFPPNTLLLPVSVELKSPVLAVQIKAETLWSYSGAHSERSSAPFL